MKGGLAREKHIQNCLNHIRTALGLSALMTLTMSGRKIASILVALLLYTALVYFHSLPVVLKFFSIVWICRKTLGRNTNLPLVQQTLLVPQLSQSSCIIFFTVSEWHQLVLMQKTKHMDSITVALQSYSRWAVTSFCHRSAIGASSCPPCPQLSTPKASQKIPVLQWHWLHSPNVFIWSTREESLGR